jgi:hypothetical protein
MPDQVRHDECGIFTAPANLRHPKFLFRSNWPLLRPATGLNPEPLNPEPLNPEPRTFEPRTSVYQSEIQNPKSEIEKPLNLYFPNNQAGIHPAKSEILDGRYADISFN